MLDILRHWFVPHHTNNQRARVLHPTGLIVIMLAWMLLQFGLEGTVRLRPDILGYASQIAVEEIVRLTNERRQAQGLSALQLNSQLSQAAAQKAADMVAKDYWAHVSPTGTQPWSFITQSGYSYRYAGENLARNFSTASAIVQAWMDSPTHRDNLLSSKYQDIGIAIIDGTLTGNETTLVVQMFGTKLSAVAAKPQTGSISIVKPVAAQQSEVKNAETVVVPATSINPFTVTKIASMGIIGLFVVIFAIDVMYVNKHKLMRWTSKSFAHLCLMLFLFVASLLIGMGKII